MAFKNYYKVLGLKNFAPEREIKKAYRSLAFRYHPDQNKGGKAGTERFYEIKEAYETLLDPIKRRHYDASLRAMNIYAPSYGFGKYVSDTPTQTRGAAPAVQIEPATKTPFWVAILKPLVLIIITAGLMFIILKPPFWITRILHGHTAGDTLATPKMIKH